jgi:hypothetical protein
MYRCRRAGGGVVGIISGMVAGCTEFWHNNILAVIDKMPVDEEMMTWIYTWREPEAARARPVGLRKSARLRFAGEEASKPEADGGKVKYY